jgi:hypothetical protein
MPSQKPVRASAFRGNKAALPSKPMSWRRAWAKNWDELRYCSEACRNKKKV